MKKLTALVLLSLCLVVSCKKNQLNGNSTIKGKVSHHHRAIPFSRVFIKFNAKEFPGTDTTLYDAKVVSDAEANYEFKVYKGNYYLYGVGYDTEIKKPVTGGVPVSIDRSETVETEVPVTE